ncbi:MAG: DUF3379 family protein [Planctomycetes bacterium]|nr:DUF3379 family protein [Planctomycetota bacterium]
MDCRTARLLSELRGKRVSELPRDDAASLDQHLKSCFDCQRLVLLEQQYDAPIAKAMKAVPVPANLKARIFDRLATQRGAWQRKRFFYAAAAAACVIFAVGILTWKPANRARLDLNELVHQSGPNFEGRQDKLDQWLATQGIRYQAPVPFNPHLLAFHGMTTVQGKQVPTLYYSNVEQKCHAQVFIIREPDFDLTNLPENFGGSLGFGQQIKIFREPGQPMKQAYVILFTGDSLDPLLVRYLEA